MKLEYQYMEHTSTRIDRAASSKAVGSLARGLLILEYLLVHEGSTQSQVAKALQIPKATLYRLVNVLIDSNFVVAQSDKRLYLGPLFLLTTKSNRRELAAIELVRPLLQSLASATGEGANLAALAGIEALYIDAVEGRHLVGIFTKPSNRVPLYATGVGKALLAALSDEELQKTLNEIHMTAYTPYTLSTRERLLENLDKIRSCGLSFDRQEYADGVSCVATALEIGNYKLAVSISGPSQRVGDKELERLATILAQEVKDFCAAVGGIKNSWS